MGGVGLSSLICSFLGAGEDLNQGGAGIKRSHSSPHKKRPKKILFLTPSAAKAPPSSFIALASLNQVLQTRRVLKTASGGVATANERRRWRLILGSCAHWAIWKPQFLFVLIVARNNWICPTILSHNTGRFPSFFRPYRVFESFLFCWKNWRIPYYLSRLLFSLPGPFLF